MQSTLMSTSFSLLKQKKS